MTFQYYCPIALQAALTLLAWPAPPQSIYQFRPYFLLVYHTDTSGLLSAQAVDNLIRLLRRCHFMLSLSRLPTSCRDSRRAISPPVMVASVILSRFGTYEDQNARAKPALSDQKLITVECPTQIHNAALPSLQYSPRSRQNPPIQRLLNQICTQDPL